ncbi:MAG: glycerate kinase [Candidatus Thermoplasmatota archaeon]|nr:glycerate kinase [Candidatus Thermoplasmatota archaeon]
MDFPASLVSNGATLQERKTRADALSILSAAVEAADPKEAVKRAVKVNGNDFTINGKQFDISKFGGTKLIAFGKAAEPMTKAFAEIIEIDDGIVITNVPTCEKIGKIKFLKSSHPVPDESSVRAGEEALSLVARCHDNDLLCVLISGGGSALLEKPAVPLDDLKSTTKILLGAGCNIKEINAIRKHVSEIKGGKLAQAAAAKGCTTISIIMSDIIGDPLDMIASGPTVPDPTTFSDAVRIAKKHNVWDKLPESARQHLSDGTTGKIPETPKPGTPIFKNIHNFIIASNRIACEGARAKAETIGYKAKILTTELSGEARDQGEKLAKLACNSKPGTAIICGGETTVTLRGKGKGGRNQELVLAAAAHIAGKKIIVASMGTDGIDGPTDAAGAIADGSTLARAAARGNKPENYLENNDSYNFFEPLGDLIITGPTGTNVMDVQVILTF